MTKVESPHTRLKQYDNIRVSNQKKIEQITNTVQLSNTVRMLQIYNSRHNIALLGQVTTHTVQNH